MCNHIIFSSLKWVCTGIVPFRYCRRMWVLTHPSGNSDASFRPKRQQGEGGRHKLACHGQAPRHCVRIRPSEKLLNQLWSPKSCIFSSQKPTDGAPPATQPRSYQTHTWDVATMASSRLPETLSLKLCHHALMVTGAHQLFFGVRVNLMWSSPALW